MTVVSVLTASRVAASHTAVTRHCHNINVPGGGFRPGAGRGHGEPVTPDERAPFIRGRSFLIVSRILSYRVIAPV
jgi:hypothetical protein